MTQYRYATVLEAQNDGQPPNGNIETGDKIVKAGKHATDSIEYLNEDKDMCAIEFESVAVYKSDKRMTQREAHELAKDEWFK